MAATYTLPDLLNLEDVLQMRLHSSDRVTRFVGLANYTIWLSHCYTICTVYSYKRTRRYSAFSSTKRTHMDRTGPDKQSITSKHHTILLHVFIRKHAQASPEAGATRPSQHANQCSSSPKKCPYTGPTLSSLRAPCTHEARVILPCMACKQMHELHCPLA
jgi:hypothetical protein